MGSEERWVMTYEYEPARSFVPVGVRLPLGRTVTVGREGDLRLGVNVPDKGISRVAVEVTATEQGWDLEIRNSNGAVLHAWGQAPVLIAGRRSLAWPRIAVRVLNGGRAGRTGGAVDHWLLLQADMMPVHPGGPRVESDTASRTDNPDRPLQLSSPQEQALRTVFEPLLRWPPRLPAEPLLLSAVARRLGISETGVKDRLNHARDRALRLGLPSPVGLTNPEYLYVLAAGGYLEPPAAGHYRVTPSCPA